MAKKFFLGVGAMKCGTTWLHKYLELFPNFDFNGIKQYHIWDSFYLGNREFLLKNYSPTVDTPDTFNSKILIDILDNNPPYEQYFSNLIKGTVDSTGDITPRYALLKAEHFRAIKQRLESVGFDVKVIFLMRDPFERSWSHAKFMNQHEFFNENIYKNEGYIKRNNYKATITELEKVFSPDQIYYGIYEEMFTKEKIIELSKFCGVPPVFSYASTNPNPSIVKMDPPIDMKQQVIECYAETYDFCAQRFPQTKTLWNRIDKE